LQEQIVSQENPPAWNNSRVKEIKSFAAASFDAFIAISAKAPNSRTASNTGYPSTYARMETAYRRSVMNVTLLKALVALIPVCMLFSGSIVLFFKGKTTGSYLQLLGSGCLIMVVLTHVSEALQLFPGMHWGLEHSPGHYLDLSSAILGLTLFPIGYLLHALEERHA
jgi:Ca2+/Na+ antiporter